MTSVCILQAVLLDLAGCSNTGISCRYFVRGKAEEDTRSNYGPTLYNPYLRQFDQFNCGSVDPSCV
jgi:hypothetical protein